MTKKIVLTREGLNEDPHLWNVALCKELLGWPEWITLEELYALPDEELFALQSEIEVCRAYSEDKTLAWKIRKGLV